jgi:hypothetical protein
LENSYLGREIDVVESIYLVAIVGEFAASSMSMKPGFGHASGAHDVLCVLQLNDLYAILSEPDDPAAFLARLDEVGRRQDKHGYEHIVRGLP